ncbi:hypothetical protein [Streptomyces sp. NPDC055036]
MDHPPNTHPLSEVSDWWTTSVSRIRPGEILLRGYPVEQLIGQVTTHLNPIRTPAGLAVQPAPGRHRWIPPDRLVPNRSPRDTERRYRISPIPPTTCENAGRDDRI